ncbi:DNA-binding response regulator, NarL/FixJ family, contains REC and HTH domains [Nonomuraea solani]|uniref:DNA-binding response regulator, NarL/FixJ family, contains REC and HTH domains n=1 Tax=Nonomuraea solani TaxID=1144553 RepID=A0A1H6EXL4_9ACTN|nr:response regulator transcription factor [Nonomuraea solani]SEH02628.1 DNA-binding response regulator, NarL/FixJ family, contains REC and HTH domains [Nonomuraea solani]
MIRVVIAEDEPLLRSGLRALAEHDGDIAVVAEAGDGVSAVHAVREHRPDIVLMDIRMPVLNGIAATGRIAGDPGLDGVRIIMLTTFDEDDNVFDAIRSGACGYLLKDIRPQDLREAIRLVASGQSLLAPSITEKVMRAAASAHTRTRPELVESLSGREREVLAAIGRGLNNQEIAAELFISPETARTYVSRLLTKLPARDRTQLAIIAYESGLAGRG